jgi:hypothetical protein
MFLVAQEIGSIYIRNNEFEGEEWEVVRSVDSLTCPTTLRSSSHLPDQV